MSPCLGAHSKHTAVSYVITLQAQAHVTVKGTSQKADAAELADKEQTILELRETNEVTHSATSFT